MPRLIITTQTYPPENHPTAVMVRQLAEHMVGVGWGVTVCAGWPHHPLGRIYQGWSKKVYERKRENGVEVVRSWHLTHSSRRVHVRAAVYVSQALAAAIGAYCERQADVVLVFGPPLVGPNLGAIVAAYHRAKLVNVIYDIYPDVAIETGKVTSQVFVGAARFAERIQYGVSDVTIVLSEGFKRTLIERGVPESRIAVIPVWLDQEEIRPLDRDNAWRREQGITLDKFVVMYAGTIGVVSGAAMVADAAALLGDREDVLILFVGEGEEKTRLEARANELRLRNIRFLPFQPRERLSEVLSTADVGLVTLSPGRGRTSVPSKVLGYMAAARPTIASVDEDSDTAIDIVKGQFGVVLPPSDPVALADCIIEMSCEPMRLQHMSDNARGHFCKTYSKNRVLHQFKELLEALVSSKG